MRNKSKLSQNLEAELLKNGFPALFCEEISRQLNTDFTAKIMLGYLKNVEQPTIEMVVDEMLSILELRQKIMERKISSKTNAAWSTYLANKTPAEDQGVDMIDSLILREIRIDQDLPRDAYYSRLPSVRQIQRIGGLKLTKPVTILVGENGTGKSTLIEAIAISMGLNPEGGSIYAQFATKKSHSDLWEHMSVVRGTRLMRDGYFLRAESFYNVASYIDELEVTRSYGGKSLHEQSHGESFLSLIENRFGGKGFYVLDEPEAALSPTKLMHLMVNIQRLVEDQSQLIISTHSPILMTYPGADILYLTEDGIRHADYRETEHYQLIKQFIECPDRMLRYLLQEE